MPVLEITLLRLKPGTEYNTPELLSNLRTIRSQLKTNSRFYLSTQDPTHLYIFGIWPSLAAHHDFLASPECPRILGPQEHQTEFMWGTHMEADSMDDLPLEAPIMLFSRETYDFASGGIRELRYSVETDDGSIPPHFKGWRIDAPRGEVQHLLFAGGKTEEECYHIQERAGLDTGTARGASTDCMFKGRESFTMRDLEKMVDGEVG